ncbi:MAG: bifunctional DNA-formamidopyrimidine glycosylase/DNA-(apurinic or apyrimidinic site) lyase [Alphaproteobacteria bacterium]|nr:bifunctional DNA-formamidopyrimidine glycosylase/DNA-(apurinic or apyrimidinic site) lyase [Alphaproteobacteria bacterium]
MPELPEVETVCRGLAKVLEGRRLTNVEARRPDLRIPLPQDFCQRLTGNRVVRVGRRAKYMVVSFADGAVLISHLGMSGRMVIAEVPHQPPGAHDHIIFTTDEGVEIRFNDARRFGLMTLDHIDSIDAHPLLAGLGPEPLSNSFSGPVLAAAIRGRRSSIKAALLDQRVVAGIGNIYASEALYQAGISPRRRAGTVQRGRADRLSAAIRTVLERAIEAGGSSLRDHRQATGELGYFQHQWAVYDRAGAPCPDCSCDHAANGGIRRIVQQGRSTFYCPLRQR